MPDFEKPNSAPEAEKEPLIKVETPIGAEGRQISPEQLKESEKVLETIELPHDEETVEQLDEKLLEYQQPGVYCSMSILLRLYLLG